MQIAQLCHSCGFGSHGLECLQCGDEISRGGVIAELCASCSSITKDNCIKCSKPISVASVTALLCGRCGFQPAGKKCVKCGRYVNKEAARAASA
jgi:hypothetical protein